MKANEGTNLVSGNHGGERKRSGNHSRKTFSVTFTVLTIIGMVWFGNKTSDNVEEVKMSDVEAGEVSWNHFTAWKAPKWKTPEPEKRCDWVLEQFLKRDKGVPVDELIVKYKEQSTDFNVFYRATAHLYWNDFYNKDWDRSLIYSLRDSVKLPGGIKAGRYSFYTWVTGDQHLSNFGAWRNRHGDVVFGVNDFDEAAIYDFEVDVYRVAVSVYNHAFTNGLSKDEIRDALSAFFDTYVETVVGYIGNENAAEFELTSKTTTGKLKKYLKKVEDKYSRKKQLGKFTEVDETTGERHFIKGEQGEPHIRTKLMAVPPAKEDEIRDAFTSTKYGATMMKIGWGVRPWDDRFFTVVDVAQRIGTGIGSFGVPRYYVLLHGTDNLLTDGSEVILDVKYETTPAFAQVLTPDETAWYKVMFPNEASRVVEAQRRLTSFTDPYTGWIILNNTSYYVRQRSPYKNSPDLDKLTDPDEFTEFMQQVAVATATSHVRGSVAEPGSGDFKHAVKAYLGDNWRKRKEWMDFAITFCYIYHLQVLMDYECFDDYVTNFTEYHSAKDN